MNTHHTPLLLLLLAEAMLLLATGSAAASAAASPRDVSIGVVDASLNSAFKVYAVSGAMDWRGPIENANSSLLRGLLPCIACPSCALEAHVVVLQAPTVSLSARTGATVNAKNGLVTILTNGTTIATISTSGSANMTVFMAQGNAKYIRLNITVTQLTTDIESVCGGQPVSSKLKSAIESLINDVVQNDVVPFLNGDKFPGIPLPVIDGFQLTAPTVSVQDAIIVVSADISETLRPLLAETTLLAATPPPSPPLHHRSLERAAFETDGDFRINASVSAINKVIQSELPVLEKQIQTLSIPAESGENGGVSWSTSATSIDNFQIGKATIAVDPGFGISLTLSGLRLALPRTNFKVSKHIIVKLSCSGHFSGSLDNTAVTIKLAIARNKAGAPVVTPTSTWTWGDLDVSAKLNSIACKVVKDIVQLFEGNIDDKIRDTIRSAVPPKLDEIITEQANAALTQLTEPINVDQYASIAMALAKNPVFSDTDVELRLLGVWGPPRKGEQEQQGQELEQQGRLEGEKPRGSFEDACSGLGDDEAKCDASSGCTFCQGGWAHTHGCYTKEAASRLPPGMFTCDNNYEKYAQHQE
jgi:hypothetical protein